MAIGVPLVLDSLQAAGTAVTATGRTSMTLGSTQARFTLPANSFKTAGDIFYLYASGIISSAITTPGTARFDVGFGGTAIFDTQAIPLNVVARTNVPWELEIRATVRTPGTACTGVFTGHFLSEDAVLTPLQATGPGPGGTLVPYSGTATGASTAWATTFDATVSQLIDLNFTQTVATGSCQLLQMYTQLLTWTGF